MSGIESTRAGRSRVTRACGWREGKRGGYVWHYFHGNVHILRAAPPSILRLGSGARVWRRQLELPFELSTVLRELSHEEDVLAGRRTLASIPAQERPLRRPYRMHRRDALRRFFVDVPDAVQRALSPWSSGSFALFRFLMTTPAAVDLMASEDGARLAWCLANAHDLREPHITRSERGLLRRARTHAARRRREALGFVGLPTTTAALSALAKVPHASVCRQHIETVRAVLKTPELHNRARHLPVWNHALDLLKPELHRHVHQSFLLELSAEASTMQDWNPLPFELRETLDMLRAHGSLPPVFRCRAHLRDVHDDMVRRRSPLSPWWSTTPFPPLPIVLSPRELAFMRPLTDSAALAREGEEMHHCLGSAALHHALASVGSFYAFALTKPTRLTLAVIWSRSLQRWHVYDLRGPANARASDAAVVFSDDIVARFERAGPPTMLSSGSSESLDRVAAADAWEDEQYHPFVPADVDDHVEDGVDFYDDCPY